MIYNIYRIKGNIMKKEDKKELVRLLKLALLDIQEMVEYLIKEIKSELK